MARAAMIVAVILAVHLQAVEPQSTGRTTSGAWQNVWSQWQSSMGTTPSYLWSALTGFSSAYPTWSSSPSGRSRYPNHGTGPTGSPTWSMPPSWGSWSPSQGTGHTGNPTWSMPPSRGSRTPRQGSGPTGSPTWSMPPSWGSRTPRQGTGPTGSPTWSMPPSWGSWSPSQGTGHTGNPTWSMPPSRGSRTPRQGSGPTGSPTWSMPPSWGSRTPRQGTGPTGSPTWSMPPSWGSRTPRQGTGPTGSPTWSMPPSWGSWSPSQGTGPTGNPTWSMPPSRGSRTPSQGTGPTGSPRWSPSSSRGSRTPSQGTGPTRSPTGGSRTPGRSTPGRTQAPPRVPSTPAPHIFATHPKLTQAQASDMLKVFDANSVSSFSGSTMFDPTTGELSSDFWNSLDSDEQAVADKIASDWSHVIDLSGKFNDSKPEDVQFFVQLFSRTDETKLTKLTTAPSTFQPSDARDVPLEILGVMNDTLVQDTLSQLPQPTVDEICKKLEKGEVNFKLTKTIVKGVNCSQSFKSSTVSMCGTLSKAIADNKMSVLSPGSWTNDVWEESIKNGWIVGLPYDILTACPESVVRNNMNLIKDLLNCLDKRLRDALMDKIKSSMGGGNSMTASDISSMGSMVADLSVKDLKQLDVTAVKNSLSTFSAQANDMSATQKAQIRQLVKQTISQPVNLTGAEIAESIAFLGDDKDVVDQLDKDQVASSIDQIGLQKLDKKASKLIAKKLMESSDYDSPTKFTVAKLKKLGSVIDGLSPDNFKKMTNVNFGDALSQGVFKDQDLSKDSSRVIVDKITSGGQKISKDDFKNLGKAVAGLKKDHIDNMTADDLKDAMQNMTATLNDIADDMDATTVNSMIEKMEQATGGLVANLESLGKLQRSVSVATLQNATDSDFGDMSGATERNFNCTSKTCPEFFKRVVSTIGTPSLKNSNYTVSVFKNLNYVMCGMSTDIIKSLPATAMMDEAAGYLLDLGCLSDKQERDLAMKKKLLMGIIDDTVGTVETADIEKYGGLLKHFSYDELKKLGSSACATVIQVLGKQDLSNVMKSHLQDLTKYAVECVNKLDLALTSDDMDQFGMLVCGLSADKVRDVAGDAMQDVVVTVQKFCPKLSNSERSKWASSALDMLNMTASNINDDDVKVEQMGTLVRDMDPAILDQLNTSTWRTCTPNIADQFNELQDQTKVMTKRGFGKAVSDTDKTDAEAKDKTIYGKMLDSMATVVSLSGRRKRSTTTLTCSDMQLLGSGVTSMTTSQIEALADQDYLDCASTLGGYSTWSAAQLTSLLTVASRSATYGSHTSWSADDVYTVSIVAQALTDSQITALTALSIDSMFSLGRHSGWGETKLAAGFARWLSLNKGNDASTITSTELIALGNFACGATTTHINSMDSTKYSYAASQIGALTSCTEAQLEAYAALAKTAFGAITSWDTSVISTVGSVIGGLSATELGTLSTAQVAAIDPTVIATIPSTAFVGFTVDQLSGYSVAQAQSTTTAQHVGLSTDQRNALIAAGATIQSAASATQVSMFVLLLSVIVPMLNHFSKL